MKLDDGHVLLDREDAPLRVLMFHHAGGSAMSFLPLARRLPPECEPVLFELPGRGLRQTEPPAKDFARAVDRLLPEVAAMVDRPTLVVGHSLGALIAHSVVAGLPRPEREHVRAVVVSAFPSPPDAARAATQPAEPFQVRDRDGLLAELRIWGGCAPEVFEDADLLDFAITLMGHDLHLADTYRPPCGDVDIAADYHVWFGRDDDHLVRDELRGWATVTRRPPSVREFRGGHFYLTEGDQAAAALGGLVADLL